MSTPSKLKRAPQYNTTPQPTSEFDPLYPEHARIREDEEREAKSEGAEEAPIPSLKDPLAYYCANCGYTVRDVAAAGNPCTNCGGKMVLTTL